MRPASLSGSCLLLAVLVTACSNSSASAPDTTAPATTTPSVAESSTAGPDTAGSGTTRPSTAGPTTGSGTVGTGKPGTPATGSAAVPRWSPVLRQPIDGEHLVAHHRRYQATRASDDGGTTTVLETATRRVVFRHAPAEGFVAQSPVVLDDRWALIQEIRSSGPDPEIRAYRYDLRSGTRQDLAKVAGLPRIGEPELGAYGGTFAYSTVDARRRSCLVVAELASLKSRTVSCVAEPGYVADPVVSTDSVTFSELTAPETAQRCKRVLVASLAGGTARPVAAAKSCGQWSGASLGTATVWSEVAATDPDQYQSKAYLRESADGPAKPLGTILTDTIVPCGTWIHWQVRAVVEGVEKYTVNRWRPGISAPQPIYTSAPDTALSTLSCQHGRLLVESAQLGGGEKYTEALMAPAG